MHLLAFASLKNRALIALVTISSLVFGAIALQGLRTELAPDIEFPQLAVTAEYEGASPEVVAADVTDTIERALQTVPDLKQTTGTSSQGAATVLAEFEYGTALATTEQKVQQALSRIQGMLPDGVTTNVISGSIADFPIIQLAVAIGDARPEALADQIELDVIPRLERLDGVRSVDLSGVAGQRVSVVPDEEALAEAGLMRTDLADVIAAAGRLSPAGTIDDADQTLSVQLGEQLASVDDVAALPIGGVMVADVADVTLEQSPTTSVSLVDGQAAVTIAITKTQTANTVDVSDAVRDVLPELAGLLGTGHEITVVFDQAPFISHSIDALATEGLLGLVMAIIVILVFLLSIRSTFVTAISIPTSLLVTFIGLWAFGYTLNILTLGALTIAIGRVVDDSIVVVENIKRHLGFERDRMRAVRDGVREVAGAITASTLTTIVVFLPLAFVSDIAGELFRPFAITSSLALAASLLVSLTIVPVLAYWLLRSTAKEPLSTEAAEAEDAAPAPRGLARLVPGRRRARASAAPKRPAATPELLPANEERGPMRRGYARILKGALRRPIAVLVAAVVIFGGSLGLMNFMGLSFLGDSGENAVRMSQSIEPGLSLERQTELATDASERLQNVDGIETVQVTIGGSGLAAFMGGGGSSISYSVTAEQGADMAAVTEDLRAATDDLEGEFSIAQSGFASSDMQVDVQAADPDVLTEAVDAIVERLQGLDELAQVQSDLAVQQPLVQVAVDRQEAAERGLTEAQVIGMVTGATQPQPVGSIQLEGAQVTMYLTPADPPETVDELRAIEVPTLTGPASLADLASVDIIDAPAQVTTVNSVRSAAVTAAIVGSDVAGASAVVEEALAEVDMPAGAEWTIGGVTQQMTEALSQLGLAALIAILLVYIVMVATFKSLLQPLLLLVSVPFAATGAIILQLLSGIPLGVASMVGVLMLIGIVVTNAIVLVDLVNQYRARGLNVRDAVEAGAERRLRPILMTAAATIFALVPMALGITGQGGFISQPLAIVVIGGLVSSTLLTLIVLPVLYAVVEGMRERRASRRR